MEQVFFAHPVIAKVIAVVRGQHNHGVVHPSGINHVLKQAAKLVVALLDEAHIGRHHDIAHLVAVERLGDGVLLVLRQHRMRVLAFAFRADNRLDILAFVHVVVGGGHDVGPVRFDIGKMCHPGRVATAVQKINGAGGQPRCLAVFFTDVGWFVGMLHQPARRNRAIVVHTRIRVVVPGVARGVANGFQVFIIGRATLVVEPVRAFGPQPVIADPGVKAAFGKPCADHPVACYAQPVHAFGIRDHVGLADQPAFHADPAQMVADALFANLQRIAVPLRAVAVAIAPGIGAHP